MLQKQIPEKPDETPESYDLGPKLISSSMDKKGEEKSNLQPEDDMDDIMSFLTKTFEDETNTGRHR